ncbi:MAG: hemerythrin family protein [Hyphomicrobiales bacterium]
MTVAQMEFPLTGNPLIDEDHTHFAELIERSRALADSELAAALDEVGAHFAYHFAREEEIMEASGFPPIMIHRQEHRRMIALVDQLHAALEAGEIATVRAFFEHELERWFVQHAATMDTATARWAAQH